MGADAGAEKGKRARMEGRRPCALNYYCTFPITIGAPENYATRLAYVVLTTPPLLLLKYICKVQISQPFSCETKPYPIRYYSIMQKLLLFSLPFLLLFSACNTVQDSAEKSATATVIKLDFGQTEIHSSGMNASFFRHPYLFLKILTSA